MSVGFLVQFVNNTPSTVTLYATVQDTNDWASGDSLRPDVDIKALVLDAHSLGSEIHEERANSRPSAPFTVTIAIGTSTSLLIGLDGCDAENLANDGGVPITGGSEVYAVYQMTSHAAEVGGNYNKMTIFITQIVSTKQ